MLKCGFKIGGGIDQDFRKSPQGYTDNVSELEKPKTFPSNQTSFVAGNLRD